jgi:hypothetical protein
MEYLRQLYNSMISMVERLGLRPKEPEAQAGLEEIAETTSSRSDKVLQRVEQRVKRFTKRGLLDRYKRMDESVQNLKAKLGMAVLTNPGFENTEQYRGIHQALENMPRRSQDFGVMGLEPAREVFMRDFKRYRDSYTQALRMFKQAELPID